MNNKLSKKELLAQKLNEDLLNTDQEIFTSASTATVVNTDLENESKLIEISLDSLKPFDKNPRLTENPKFEEIKESIRVRGLDYPPNVTKRPGEDKYIISDGGNTRLKALHQLFVETQDPKFWVIKCVYKPWDKYYKNETQDEHKLVIAHLIENDLRADLSFIEKALSIYEVKKYYEDLENKTLSSRELSERLAKDGYVINFTLVAKMLKTVEILYPSIPKLLMDRMSRNQIEKLLTIYGRLDSLWQEKIFSSKNNNENIKFLDVWLDAIKIFNDDLAKTFKLSLFKDVVIGAFVNAIGNDIVSYDEAMFIIENPTSIFANQDNEFIDTDENEDSGETIISNNTNTSEKIDINNKSKASVSPSAKTNNEDATEKQPVQLDIIEEIKKQDEATNKDNEESSIADSLDKIGLSNNGKSANPLDVIKLDYRGLLAGYNREESIKILAEFNGLTAANSGSYPVWDLWKVANLKNNVEGCAQEVFYLFADLCEEAGINPQDIMINLGKEGLPILGINDKFNVDKEKEPLKNFIFELGNICTSGYVEDINNMQNNVLFSSILFGNLNNEPIVSEKAFIKIMRILVLTRKILLHMRNGNFK